MLYLFLTPIYRKEQGHRIAHSLLEWAYRSLWGQTMPPLFYTKAGKPYWENGRFCSISHSKTLAVCALSDRPVGVDCETIRPLPSGFAERVYHPEEQTWIGWQPDPNLAALTLWTWKESYGKLTGVGIHGRGKEYMFSFCPDPMIRQAVNLSFDCFTAEGCVIGWCTKSNTVPVCQKVTMQELGIDE